jgi:hypothetical protein
MFTCSTTVYAISYLVKIYVNVNENNTLEKGYTDCLKIWKPPQNSRHQNVDVKGVSYWGLKNIKLQCTNFKHHGELAPGACAFVPRNVTDTGKLCYVTNFTGKLCYVTNFTGKLCYVTNFTGKLCYVTNFTGKLFYVTNFTGKLFYVTNFTGKLCCVTNFTGKLCYVTNFTVNYVM